MRIATTALCLLFALIIMSLGLTQILDLEAEVTSLSGGFAEFFNAIPTIFLISVVSIIGVATVMFAFTILSRD